MSMFAAYSYYTDEKCRDALQNGYIIEDANCMKTTADLTTCSASQYPGYFVEASCTTFPESRVGSDFDEVPFVGFTVFNSTSCEDGHDVATVAYLATGTCQMGVDWGSAIATVDADGLSTLQIFTTMTDCTGDSYALVASKDYIADPYCVQFNASGYSFIAPSSTDSSSGSSSKSTTGLVYSVYSDDECSNPAESVYIAEHGSCMDVYGSSGSVCTKTYAGPREIFFKASCLSNYSDRSARTESLVSIFGSNAYLAVDSYLSANCSDGEFEYTYAYRGDGECHDAFDHESAKVTFGADGSAVLERSTKLQEHYDCAHSPMTSRVSSTSITSQSCVAGGGTGFVFYSTAVDPSVHSAVDPSSGQVKGQDASSGSKDGVAIGIAAGGAVAVLLVIVASVWWWRTRRTRRDSHLREPFVEPIATVSESSKHRTALSSVSTDHNMTIKATSEMWDDRVIIGARVPREKVLLGPLIAQGGYGEVYRGTFNDQQVAVKMLRPETRRDLDQVNAFLAEIKLWSTLDHPCITRFVGVAWDSLNDLCVLCEFLDGGDLRVLLTTFDSSDRPTGFDVDKLRIAYNIANALTYLHSLLPPVIHRDLKSRNVLLTEDLDAKLTDFGISRERAEATMTAGIGTSLWMAPEVMMSGRYDEKADMFSFGVLLSEMDSHRLPYAHIRAPHAQILQSVAMGQLQVQFSPTCAPAVVELGLSCVAIEPSERPTAAQAMYTLHTILRTNPTDSV